MLKNVLPLDTLVVDKEKRVAFNAFLVMVVAIVISPFLCCVRAPLTAQLRYIQLPVICHIQLKGLQHGLTYLYQYKGE